MNIKDNALELTSIPNSSSLGFPQDKYPSIPWQEIIGMRNRLIHGYDDIDFEILYQTITEDFPPLITQLEKLVSSDFT